MPPSSGQRLGPYELLDSIGSGGMGDVYRARDTRLDRIVAVKVSKQTFSERVESEARAAAALNHPNICALYDVGPDYLVMEHVDGTRLSGPVPLHQSLKYAIQICAALDAAHRNGITHRDLKPANIMVTRFGSVKLLDFGLAKIKPAIVGNDAATMALTAAGQIVGTLHYMSPEQLQGQDADPRSDIFSFGLVLYELLTGMRAFDGTSPASIIAAILERPAPSIADTAPPALDRTLRRCLEKAPDDRWQSARDLGAELEWIAAQPSQPSSAASTRAMGHAATRRLRIAWMTVAMTALIAVGLAYLAFGRTASEPRRKLAMSIVADQPLIAVAGFALSPNGGQLAFITDSGGGGGEIWVRDLDSPTARRLPSTVGRPALPFWSPDGRWIGYEDSGVLKKVPVAGGPAVDIVNATGVYLLGASWGANDTIVFSSATGVMRVPASGGTPSLIVARPRGGTFPSFFPDGRHFMFGSYDPNGTSGLYVADVNASDTAANAQPILVPGPIQAAYSNGSLVFARNGVLLAQPFDITRWTTSGDAVVVAENVDRNPPTNLFHASTNGDVVYTSRAIGRQLTWFDRTGKAVGEVGNAGVGYTGTISPDGSTIAFDSPAPGSDSDVWLYEVARGAESRLTSGPVFNAYPIWSPDGTRLVHWAFREAIGELIERTISGSTPERVFPLAGVPKVRDRYPTDWSRDARFILMNVAAETTKQDIWVVPVSGDQPFPYLASNAREVNGKFSPNGRWVAYVSDETNRFEVYVESFPKPGRKIRVSTTGGAAPLWSRDGKELHFSGFSNGTATVMTVAVDETGDIFRIGAPKALFAALVGGDVPGFPYDVSKDGRFLIPVPQQSDRVPLNVVINWNADSTK